MDLKPRTRRARALRRDQTDAERRLWRMLCSRQLAGYKFRRQLPIDRYFADFACVEARLVVEVDGPSHETQEGRAKDIWRDRCLRGMGWRVVRVPNALVIAGGDLALAPIRAALEQGKP